MAQILLGRREDGVTQFRENGNAAPEGGWAAVGAVQALTDGLELGDLHFARVLVPRRDRDAEATDHAVHGGGGGEHLDQTPDLSRRRLRRTVAAFAVVKQGDDLRPGNGDNAADPAAVFSHIQVLHPGR